MWTFFSSADYFHKPKFGINKMYFRHDQYIYPTDICQLLHFNIIISLKIHEKQNVGIGINEILFKVMFHGIPPINLTLPQKTGVFFVIQVINLNVWNSIILSCAVETCKKNYYTSDHSLSHLTMVLVTVTSGHMAFVISSPGWA